jgi:poly(A) polymerase
MTAEKMLHDPTTDLKGRTESVLRDPVLSKLSFLAKQRGIPLFLVGGYLRDLFLGTHRRDYDLVLPREASSFIPLLEGTLGFRFFKVGNENTNTLTYRVTQPDLSVDLTLLQGRTIDEDLSRRDFTINTLAFSLRDETFHWVEGALEDIKKKTIRAVTSRSIDQDPLRLLRAVRYLSTLDGFQMDRPLIDEITLKKAQIGKIPGERIKGEMDKILLSPRMALGMKVLCESSLLLTLFPELRGLEAIGQGEYHHLDVLSHILLAVDKISWALGWLASHDKTLPLSENDRLCLCYSALFHDLGKGSTSSRNPEGSIHFYHHEALSCIAAEEAMVRFRFSNRMRAHVLQLVKNHMKILNFSKTTREAALKRLVNTMGELTPLLVVLTLADKEASRGILSLSRDDVVERHCLRILELLHQEEIVHPLRLVTGHDVIALGIPPGPKVGRILNAIRRKQIVGEIKTREEGLKVLSEEVAHLLAKSRVQ